MKTYTTKSCFKDFGLRDSDIDNWLPKKMPVIEDGNSTIYKTNDNQTFIDMFKSNGLMTEDSVIPHCFSLQTIEKMCGENDDRLNQNYYNFFPITDGKKVFVLRVYWYDSRWRVHVFGFGGGREWYADDQLFLRTVPLTLDQSILEQAIKVVKDK